MYGAIMFRFQPRSFADNFAYEIIQALKCNCLNVVHADRSQLPLTVVTGQRQFGPLQ